MRRISLLAYPGCMGTEIFGISDTLLVANHVSAALFGNDEPLFDVRVQSKSGNHVEMAGGIRLTIGASHQHPDLLVIPGFEFSNITMLDDCLRRYHVQLRYIASAYQQGISLASICVGSFLLAEAGILNNRSATTAWLFAPEFTRRYPSVRLRKEDLLVDDSGVMTTGAFSSALDLGLHLIREHAGQEIADTTGKILLHESSRKSQTRFIDHALLERPTGAFSSKVKEWLQKNMSVPYQLDELAAAFNVSTRTLNRRFKAETGITPLGYLQKIRIGSAKKLLTLTDLNVSEIVERLGYEDVSSFIRMYNRQVGCSPSSYRQQFRVSNNQI